MGRVRGIIETRKHDDAEVLDAIESALIHVSQALLLSAPQEDLPTDDEGSVPGPELPAVALHSVLTWMAGRVGYGNRDAKAWFLGMEEACEDVLELPARIEGGFVEDLEAALTRIGRYPNLLTDAPRLQPTWAPLIRSWLVATSMNANSPGRGEIREYQRRRWGRSNGETLLLELLPLPSPSLQVWPYAGLGIGTRAEYQERWLPQRIKLLRALWQDSRTAPRVAVAYGRSNWNHYRDVFGLPPDPGEPLWSEDPTWAQGYTCDAVAVVLVRHPVAFGNSNARWETLGRWLRARLHT